MASPNVVILLVGLHGVGKSTFTRAATHRQDIRLGRGVTPCTEECSTYSFSHVLSDRPPKEVKVTIIDTPGLADTDSTDQNLEVLQRIADQLRDLGQEKVSGVIYFHSIEGTRLHGVDMKNLRLLKAICGEPFNPRVAFVTTRWDRMRDSDYDSLVCRNAQLEVERRKLLPEGPAIFRFLNDGKSHEPVLDFFANKGGVAHEPLLLFAKELGHYRRRRVKTAVGKTTAGRQINNKGKDPDTFVRGLQSRLREMFDY